MGFVVWHVCADQHAYSRREAHRLEGTDQWARNSWEVASRVWRVQRARWRRTRVPGFGALQTKPLCASLSDRVFSIDGSKHVHPSANDGFPDGQEKADQAFRAARREAVYEKLRDPWFYPKGALMRTLGWTSVPCIWETLAEAYRDVVALIDEHNPHHEPIRWTYASVHEEIRAFAAGLRHHGSMKMQPGDMVALFSENSARWLVADQAIMWNGAATAVRGTAAPVDELAYILEHSNAVGLVVDTPNVLEKLVRNENATRYLISHIRFIVLLWRGKGALTEDVQALGASVPMYAYEDVVKTGAQQVRNAIEMVSTSAGDGLSDRALWHPLASTEMLATLVYTSGTTGQPKGAMLCHRNLLHQIYCNSFSRSWRPFRPSQDASAGEVMVNILPCWHIFERTSELYALSRGVTMVYSKLLHFKEDLSRHRPHLMVGVPRLYENIYQGIKSQLMKQRRFRRLLIFGLLDVSIRFVHWRRVRDGALFDRHVSMPERLLACIVVMLLWPLHILADLIAWRRLRQAALGGRVRTLVSGGGSLAMFLDDFFEAIGVLLIVGYGLTETSPVVANRLREHNVRGTTGLAVPGTDLKIVDPETRQVVSAGQTGIICARGEQIFQGYYKEPEATSRVFDSDGFFDTGDLGFFSPHTGDLVITGRLKDVIVLSNGENVEPTPIEDTILGSEYVEQVMLVGQDQRSLGALIVPNLDALEANALLNAEQRMRIQSLQRERATCGSFEAGALDEQLAREAASLEGNAALHTALQKELMTRIESRKNYLPIERVTRFRILLTPFTVDDGTLTQTLKVRRNAVSARYAALIRSMYES
ncbi:Acyl-CoA synthetase long-chain member [Cyanidiococcus yangmingshanensis]|uniref:Acyl-CoA synthetase long-chain member n=1 Tax=Cyanidiococcus yangmingshanensis TaxID=2690220 RepID=A0A7J7IRQ8_9RHOD|nr:Acyl-CoA synthetase long-chain member [Cyanidiococcus yangmingshanensis]